MPRPRKFRCCRRYQADRVFKPQGIPMRGIETTVLSLDQFEALRLCDAEELDQEEAGRQMGVSRGTIQRLLYSARRQMVEALLHNHAIIINLKEDELTESEFVESEATDAGMHPHQRKCRAGRHRM